jgi:ribonucleoside-diphosphate reductase subunit M1
VCNLASLNLSAFVDEANRTYDFKRLYEVTKVVAKNLNKVIDVNFYPVIEVRASHFEPQPYPPTLRRPKE